MENKILVVDDEKEIREFLNKALSRLCGYRVDLAESGEEALRKIEKDRFDLVLTDLKMPKMDGLQLIAEIAKSKPETLTMMMTGHGTIDPEREDRGDQRKPGKVPLHGREKYQSTYQYFKRSS